MDVTDKNALREVFCRKCKRSTLFTAREVQPMYLMVEGQKAQKVNKY